MLNKYKDWLENIQRLSLNTIITYMGRMEILSHHLDLNNLTEEGIATFLTNYTQGKSPNTLNGYINTLSSFLEFQKKNIIIAKVVPIKKHNPNYITEKEFLDRIIPVVEYYCETDILKMKSLLYFMFYTGARTSDIKYLQRKDIDFTNKYVTFRHGKGDKDRDVPLLDLVIELIQKYFSVEAEETNAFNLNPNTLRSRLISISDIIGDLKITPHTLRHSYAMWYLNEFGDNIRNLQLNMGHNDIKTTMQYLNIKNKDRIENFKIKEKEWLRKRKKK